MIFKVAWRNIWRAKVRSFIVIGSIAVGIWAGLLIAYESTEDATYASGMGLISIIAITRLAMHPMWKKEKQTEEE